MISDLLGMLRRTGIRGKFIAAFAALTVASCALLILAEQFHVRHILRSDLQELGSITSQTAVLSGGRAIAKGQTADLQRFISGLQAHPAISYADFVNADGTVLAATAPAVPAELVAQHSHAREETGPDHSSGIFIVPLSGNAADASQGFFRLLLNDQTVRSGMTRFWLTSLLMTALAVALAIALGQVVSRRTIDPLSQLATTAQVVSSGDLTRRVAAITGDEIGNLGQAFNAMAERLERTIKSLGLSQQKLKSVVETVGSRSRTVIERVDLQRSIIDDAYHSIDKLNGGIRTITDNVESLSASSEETSSSMLQMVASMEEVSRHSDTLFEAVEETSSATTQMLSSISEVDQNVVYLTNFVTDTSSSMVEMSASIAQVQSNAARSYDLSLAVADAAEKGMGAVRETIEGMEQIRQSVADANAVVSRLGDRSAAIGKILNVIEDVAEQTNLLALNAAILAAQAGEYGKGFSVVAAEIRELSERTATSTREISGLIRSVQSEVANAQSTMERGSRLVGEGVDLSHEAGRALNNILESASTASGMAREIAGATKEQAQGSETVSRAIERLQELVQQISGATAQQTQGSDHIMRAVEQMREITKYVRQAMVEQRSGSAMISSSAERMIEMIHEIFQVAASQSSESEKIVKTMEDVRGIAEGNRVSAAEMSDAIQLLDDSIRSLDDEIQKFRVHS